MKPPLIYTHFGNSFYLRFVLERAVANLPDRKVILLGDKSNQWLERTGIIHVDTRQYQTGNFYSSFQRNFRLIGGHNWLASVNARKTSLSGVNVCWTEFNFKKWIYLYSFLSERCIDSCWFLDSDVLLVDSLDSLEKSTSLSSVDWTFWNTLHQQQGWIRSRLVVREFIEHFLDIFSDKSRLSSIEYSLFCGQSKRWLHPHASLG